MPSEVTVEYTDSMVAVLDWFQSERYPRGTIGYITDEIDYSRETVRNNLKQLRAGDYVTQLHRQTALYELSDDPRGED